MAAIYRPRYEPFVPSRAAAFFDEFFASFVPPDSKLRFYNPTPPRRLEPYTPIPSWAVLLVSEELPPEEGLESEIRDFAPTRPRRQEPYDPRPSWTVLFASEPVPNVFELSYFIPARPRRQEPYSPTLSWAVLFAIEPVPNIFELSYFLPTRPRRQEPYDPRPSWTPLFPPGPGPVSPGGCAPGSVIFKIRKSPQKRPYAFVKRP